MRAVHRAFLAIDLLAITFVSSMAVYEFVIGNYGNGFAILSVSLSAGALGIQATRRRPNSVLAAGVRMLLAVAVSLYLLPLSPISGLWVLLSSGTHLAMSSLRRSHPVVPAKAGTSPPPLPLGEAAARQRGG